MVLDMKQRKTLARVDDETRRHKIDTAREIIYKKNYAVDSKAVQTILREQSLVPTSVSTVVGCFPDMRANFWPQNAFSKRLGPLGFNLFVMLIVDLMHEFELGVWKALFIHLLRILYSFDKTLVNELDRRYAKAANIGGNNLLTPEFCKLSTGTDFRARYNPMLC